MENIPLQPGLATTHGKLHGRTFRLLAGWLLSTSACCCLILQQRYFSPVLSMWSLVATIVASCKLLTWLNLDHSLALPHRSLLSYLLLWPGMRPQPFLSATALHAEKQEPLWVSGMENLLLGLLVFALALRSNLPWWMTAWLGMVAFSFVIHFGFFDLVAAAWRHAGVPVEKLFVCPVAATSLADFWGNRWNRAFSGFARDLLFRPISRRLGTAAATVAVFAFSGLVHELVISVPAGGGCGGPMLYFLLQGALVLVENSRELRRSFRQHPWRGRLWTAAAVLLPVPLLFHPPFLRNVVLPFLIALGG